MRAHFCKMHSLPTQLHSTSIMCSTFYVVLYAVLETGKINTARHFSETPGVFHRKTGTYNRDFPLEMSHLISIVIRSRDSKFEKRVNKFLCFFVETGDFASNN